MPIPTCSATFLRKVPRRAMACLHACAQVLALAMLPLLSASLCGGKVQTARLLRGAMAVPACTGAQGEAIGARVKGPLDARGFPQDAAWHSATPVCFCWDWQGANADPKRQTEVRILWSPDTLFFEFRAAYRDLYTFPDQNSRHGELWTRDVAELFIQPDTESGHHYKEIEVSPNGDWLDLAVANGQDSDLNCDMETRTAIHVRENMWTAELAIPMTCLIRKFSPKSSWHVNFFRVEAPEPNRFYSAWHPTKTPYPNFHVPEAFGILRFSTE